MIRNNDCESDLNVKKYTGNDKNEKNNQKIIVNQLKKKIHHIKIKLDKEKTYNSLLLEDDRDSFHNYNDRVESLPTQIQFLKRKSKGSLSNQTTNCFSKFEDSASFLNKSDVNYINQFKIRIQKLESKLLKKEKEIELLKEERNSLRFTINRLSNEIRRKNDYMNDNNNSSNLNCTELEAKLKANEDFIGLEKSSKHNKSQ